MEIFKVMRAGSTARMKSEVQNKVMESCPEVDISRGKTFITTT